jgi:hypothetical protein
MAVESEATTTKLTAVPWDVAFRNDIPMITVPSQITMPVGAKDVGRCHALDNSHPAAVPDRKGHAVSATPATVMPSA